MTLVSRCFIFFLAIFFILGCGKKSGIEGKVVDGQGQPMVKIKIIAKQVHPVNGYEQFETTSGSDGTFRFKGVFPSSDYTLFPLSDAWKTETKMIVKSGSEGEMSILQAPLMIRFMSPKQGIITDNKTQLMWQIDESGKQMTWDEAANYCNNLRLGEYSDWRLPTINELESLIIDKKRKPVFDTALFPARTEGPYWSSTTSDAAGVSVTGVINMSNGDSSFIMNDSSIVSALAMFGKEPKTPRFYVWPVRYVKKQETQVSTSPVTLKNTITEGSIGEAISRIKKGQHATMPQPTRSSTTGPAGKGMTIENGTGQTMSVYFTGAINKKVAVPNGESVNVDLVVGNYEVAAEVPGSNIIPFYGVQKYESGYHYWLKFSLEKR